jgi:hypothetical protein
MLVILLHDHGLGVKYGRLFCGCNKMHHGFDCVHAWRGVIGVSVTVSVTASVSHVFDMCDHDSPG